MTSHFPILQVVLPLIAAPVMILLRRGAVAWVIAVVVSAAALFIAAHLFVQVRSGEVISYAIGNWPPPWGIEYRIDAANAFVLLLVSAMGLVVALYSRRSVAAEIPQEQHYLFYTMYALCLAGLLGITATGDAFNIFVFLEISSLSTYVLIALGRDRRALMASYQYLVMGTIGATFFVIGVGLIYLLTGTLNLADMAARLPHDTEQRSILAALAFITVGVSLKLALFPLHLWLPNAYAYAPSAVTAFLAATATKVSIYVLLRFYYTVFGTEFVFVSLPVKEVLLILSIAAMFGASAVAIFQHDVKRMFAYSSVAQIGYITLGVGMGSEAGLTAGLVHLFNHALTKAALFLLLGGIALRLGTAVRFDTIAGIGRVMPYTTFGIVLGGLSLIGVPLTVGFVSKWYLITAALEQGAWWLAVLIVLSSLLAVVYVWRFVEVAYFREPDQSIATRKEAPPSMLVLSWIMIAACFYFGLDTALTLGGAGQAAEALTRSAP